jgi:hypothetical protein
MTTVTTYSNTVQNGNTESKKKGRVQVTPLLTQINFLKITVTDRQSGFNARTVTELRATFLKHTTEKGKYGIV